MKKIYSIFVCLCLLAGFVACEKDKDFALNTLVVNDEMVTPSFETAEVSCSFKADATISDAFVQYSLSSSFAKYEVAKMTEDKGKYTAHLTGLVDNTTYYIRYSVSNKYSSVVAEKVAEFKTLPCTVPTIVVDSIAGVKENQAKVHLHLTSTGGAVVTDMGICWSKQANPTTKDIHKSTDDTLAVLDITDLQPNTQYYVRAYAMNKIGIAYSEEVVFTTLKQVVLPTVKTTAASSVTETSAVTGGNVTSDGNASVTERGVVYATTQNPTTANTKVASGNGTGSFVCNLSGLQPNTKYYVRAYAINSKGTAYGEEISFTTLKQVVLPTVKTTAASSVTETSAVTGGNVTSDGNASVTERGVVYATTQNPTTSNTKVTSGSGTGSYTCNLSGLQPNTKYYVRAYAINSKGTAYGEEVSFTTNKQIVLPTVKTTAASSVTETSAVTGGNVTSDGNASVTERGVVYATTQNPTTANTKVASGSGTGSFVCNLSGLQPNTKYYVRAYAINSKGTAYGEEITFITNKSISLPIVTTAAVTSVTETSAVTGGNVTSDGNATVTERGVVYSTNPNPVITNLSNTIRPCGSGTGEFTYTITGLQANTKYYVRAYAKNDAGTAYGEEISFTTNKQVVLPTVTTTSATSVTETSAVTGGNVTSDGNASVTERGVVYATTQNPTTSNTKVTSGSGTGSYTCNLSGLQPNTTYYVRAYATNSKGTAYGTQVTFTTNKQIVLPTVNTISVSGVTESGATVSGNVTSDGNATVTERGIVYATTQNPTTANTKVKNGSGTGSYTCKITGLQPNTKYYARAYAINSKGVAYGNEVPFTTSKSVSTPTVTTTIVSSITYNYAVTGGNVTSDGGASVTERGVVYSTSQNPITTSTSAIKITSGSGVGTFSVALEDLAPSTTYYVRAYATNSKGTAYGTQVTFTTKKQVVLATVTTNSVTQVTTTTATAGGNVTSDGNGDITERGIVYSSTSQYPTTASATKVTSGTGTGTFSVTLDGLVASTTYYVRAYAKNSAGTAYGTPVTFTTKSISLPTLSATFATSVTTCTAMVGGQITDDGGAAITERGVYYSNTTNPGAGNGKFVYGGGDGKFAVILEELEQGTVYYARAYAINEKGTSYGQQVMFTTKNLSTSANSGTNGGHAYVDLGLSVKWATCNMGSSVAEGLGNQYAWGETVSKTTFSWTNYKYCKGSATSMTKYNTNSSNGVVDNLINLELTDDAAYVNWGSNWRTPTIAEWQELEEQCDWEWTTLNGVEGWKVTSSSNGNSIFLPSSSEYMSSSLYTFASDAPSAYSFTATQYWIGRQYGSRLYGRYIRPVYP